MLKYLILICLIVFTYPREIQNCLADTYVTLVACYLSDNCESD